MANLDDLDVARDMLLEAGFVDLPQWPFILARKNTTVCLLPQRNRIVVMQGAPREQKIFAKNSPLFWDHIRKLCEEGG